MDWSTGVQRVENKGDAQRVEGILRRGRLRLGWNTARRETSTNWERNGGPEEKIERKQKSKKNKTEFKGRNQTSLNPDDGELGE